MVMTNAERQQGGINIFQLLDEMDGNPVIANNNTQIPHQFDPLQKDNQPASDDNINPGIDEAGSDESDEEDKQHTTYVVPKGPVVLRRPDPIGEISETGNTVSKKGPGRPPKQ